MTRTPEPADEASNGILGIGDKLEAIALDALNETNIERLTDILLMRTPLSVRLALSSPDCRDGKHAACTRWGAAWNDERDAVDDCLCSCHLSAVPR